MDQPAASTSSAPPTKLGGYDFYREVLKSPKLVVAPMVDQSELAWRVLSRRYSAELVYTPMINAKMYAEGVRKPYREQNFSILNGEEGSSSTTHPLSPGRPLDRPLVIQFCGNNPQQILDSARSLAPHCDAVDLNLGCPQDIARRGRYGAFLQDEWELVEQIISTLHKTLPVPVTAKFRVFSSTEKTVAYARMLERAGAQILTCHGRTREQRGQNSGLADWEKIRAVKEAVNVPVFANGNILYHSDIERCLEVTGADAVMSAEGQLYNAALFARTDHRRPEVPLSSEVAAPAAVPPTSSAFDSTSNSDPTATDSTTHTSTAPPTVVDSSPPAAVDSFPWDTGLHPRHADLALEYLSIVRGLKTHTAPSAVKGHLFKLMRPALARETDLRDRLGRARTQGDVPLLDVYEAIVREMKERMDRDAREAEKRGFVEEEGEGDTGTKALPHWVAQPYFRPIPPVVDDKSKSKSIREKATVGAVSVEDPRVEAAKRVLEEEEESGEESKKRVKVEGSVEGKGQAVLA